MSTTHVEHVVLSAELKHLGAKLLMELRVSVFPGFLNRQSSLLSKLLTEAKLHPGVEWVFLLLLKRKMKKLFCFPIPFLPYTAISFHLLKMLENEPNMKTHVAF